MSNRNDIEKTGGDVRHSEGGPTISQIIFSWRSLIVLLLHVSFVVNVLPALLSPIAIVCMVEPQKAVSSSANSSLWPHPSETPPRVESGDTVIDTERSWRQMPDNIITSELENFGYSTQSYDNTSSSQEKPSQYYEFHWDGGTVGLILAASSMTSYIGPLLGSFLMSYLGNRWALGLLQSYSAVLLLLSPVAARTDVYVFVAIRILLGFCLHGCAPIVADTLAWWAPEKEKLTAMSFSNAGLQTGSIPVNLVSGFICAIPIDNGWPFLFYIFGTLSLLFTLAWCTLISQKPENHQFISDKEKRYIQETRVIYTGQKRRAKPPFRKLMTSVPVLAWFVPFTVHVFIMTITMAYLPAYFSNRLQFNVEQTGVIVSLTWVFRALGTFVWAVVGNRLKTRPGMTTNRCRKSCIATACVLVVVCQTAMAFINADLRWMAVVLWCVISASQSINTGTVLTVALDMAPTFAGFLIGVSFFIGGLIAIAGPLMFAALTSTNSYEEWRTAWLIATGISLTGFVIFLMCGQASIQPWAQVEDHNDIEQSVQNIVLKEENQL